MIVTGTRFVLICQELFGARWKRDGARALGREERMMYRYAKGKPNVPRDVRKKLAVLAYSKATSLMRIALELDPEVAKISESSDTRVR